MSFFYLLTDDVGTTHARLACQASTVCDEPAKDMSESNRMEVEPNLVGCGLCRFRLERIK